MKFTREFSAGNTIRRVSDAGFVIGEETFPGPLALTAGEILEDWPDRAIEDLAESDFQRVFEVSPEVVLLGTGATNIFPPRDLTFAFARKGIGFEVMDTAAAARTFNVLANEGRRVAAVLYL